MSGKILRRAFRFVLSLKVLTHLRASRRNRTGYERYFASVRNSPALRLLHSRMSFSFPASLEEHAVAVSSQIFAKRGIEQFYLPVEWNGQPLSRDVHLAKPSVFLSLHNRFASGSAAILELGGEVVTIAANPDAHWRRFARSGITTPEKITVLPRDAMSLVNLRKEMERGKHASCFVDTHAPQTGEAGIEDGLFRFARLAGRPVYFLRFSVNERGRIEGAVDGPVDCSDIDAAMERFCTFSGAPLEVRKRQRQAPRGSSLRKP